MSKLEYYIANANVGPNTKVKMPKCIQPHLTTPMILGSWRAFILLESFSRKWGIEVASLHHQLSTTICKLCNENLFEDEHYLLSHAQHMRSLKSTLIMYVYFSPCMSTCVHYLLLMVIIIYCRVPSPVLRKESHTTWQCLSIPICKNYLLMDK